MMERARRRESTAEFLLREKLETWARAQPRDGKTVRLPGTTHKIVFKDQEAHFEIQKEGDVVKYVLEDLGEAAAISRAVVKKKFDLLKSNLVTVFCPGGAAKEIPGATFVPKGENPVIFRK